MKPPRNLCLTVTGSAVVLPPQPGPFRLLGIFVGAAGGTVVSAAQYLEARSANGGQTRWVAMTASKPVTDTSGGGTDFALFPGADSAVISSGGAGESAAFFGPLPGHWQDARDTITLTALGGAWAMTSVNILIEDL